MLLSSTAVTVTVCPSFQLLELRMTLAVTRHSVASWLLKRTVTGLTGWLTTTDLLADGDLLEEVHEALATLTLALVGVHVLGVIFMSVLTRDNLVRAMITGRKRRRP